MNYFDYELAEPVDISTLSNKDKVEFIARGLYSPETFMFLDLDKVEKVLNPFIHRIVGISNNHEFNFDGSYYQMGTLWSVPNELDFPGKYIILGKIFKGSFYLAFVESKSIMRNDKINKIIECHTQ
jgi:hypothetical protein